MGQFFQYLMAFIAAVLTGVIVGEGIKKLQAEKARKARLEPFKRRFPPKG